MDKQFIAGIETKMKNSIESTQRELATIRTGKATTSLLDTVRVNYYGNMVPLNQTANVSAPEPRRPWPMPRSRRSLSFSHVTFFVLVCCQRSCG